MEECRFSIENSYVHYIKAGSGEKNLVIISGISLCGFEGFGASIAKQYEVFLDNYTLYYFDRRKYIDKKISLAELAEDISKALHVEGVSSANFIGFSQGGMICLEIALNHPEMVDSLILGSSAAANNSVSEKTGEKWSEWLAKDDVYHFNLEFYKSIYSAHYNEKHSKALDRLAQRGSTEECRRFEFLLDSIANINLLSRLSEIKCPCYVIGAEYDNTLGLNASKEMAKALGCECLIWPGGSHAVFDEDHQYIQKLFQIEQSLITS